MADRKISDVLTKPDVALEMTLRPSLFSEFTGQAKVKERLEITVAAAKQRGEAIDHVLLSGPPGLGRMLAKITTLMISIQMLKTSHPIITLVIFSICTGANTADTIVAAPKLITSL